MHLKPNPQGSAFFCHMIKRDLIFQQAAGNQLLPRNFGLTSQTRARGNVDCRFNLTSFVFSMVTLSAEYLNSEMGFLFGLGVGFHADVDGHQRSR
jgi:hypothetical protein